MFVSLSDLCNWLDLIVWCMRHLGCGLCICVGITSVSLSDGWNGKMCAGDDVDGGEGGKKSCQAI